MRITHGDVSFELPEGFRDESTIVISRPVSLNAKGVQLDENAYPLSLSLVHDEVARAPGPLAYLQLKLNQLRQSLGQFEVASCEAAEVGGHAAARAQFSFVAQFELHQLVLVWFVAERSYTVTLTTTRRGIEEGWQQLDAFVASLRIA